MRTRIYEFEQRDFVEQAYIDQVAKLEEKLRVEEDGALNIFDDYAKMQTVAWVVWAVMLVAHILLCTIPY